MRRVLDFVQNGLFHSLASRVIGFVFAATLMTSLVVTWVSSQSIHGFLRDNLEQEFTAALIGSAQRLELWIEQRRHEIDSLASSDLLLGGGARSQAHGYLTRVLRDSPQYESLLLLDEDGHKLFSVGKKQKLPPLVRAELARITKARVGKVRFVDGKRIQYASAPVRDHRKRNAGTLHAQLRIETVDRMLQEIPVDAAVFLVAAGGRLLTPAPSREVGQVYERALPDPDAAPRLEDYLNDSGVHVVGTALGLNEYGWALVLEASYEDAFRPSLAVMRKVAYLNLGTALLFSALAFWAAVSIVRPIKALALGARRIAEGDTDVAIVRTSTHGELGMLTGTFNRMAARLHRNRVELQENRLRIEAANVRLRGQNEELQRMNEALEQLSITDGLTKLYNHRFFQENLTREIARAERSGEELALILFDIDNFKQLNDRYGHAAGDQVLCEVARVMSGIVRESDVLARYGGEEFALVPGRAPLDGAVGLAEKIRTAVAEHGFSIDETDPPTVVRVTVSVGVAAYHGDRRDFFNDADNAMYRAKAAGKDCVVAETGSPKKMSGRKRRQN